MKFKNQLSALAAFVLLIVVVLACSSGSNETEKANKPVDEGNAAAQDAKKDITEAESLKQKMLSTDVAQLAEARSTAKEAIAAYDKAEVKCKEAAAEYDGASRPTVN